jgi:hypothetical protein
VNVQEKSIVIAAPIEGIASTAGPVLGQVTEACRTVAGWLRQAACGLTGHDMVRHFEPQRMSLQCLSCGAKTRGWALQEEPQRPVHHAHHRMVHRAADQALA